MYKRLFAFFLLLLLVAGGYAFVFGWIIPKTAAFTQPGKWRLVPLRQPRETVHGYFGEPLQADGRREEWTGGTSRRQYRLSIYYAADTTAAAYSIHYFYKSWLVNRDYLVDSGAIR
ncbi:hypothetical protein [Sediminibacterium soli]|uniref:hypothetical protein n=1 Tax=Sediminibacterium soli TaxID=2698829 RepID=UPI00137B06F2|nr:hypothetical protein [Sediminibacterium soli]NCI46251.1 hypothetical protein [Sediminibacterium soli]